VGQELFQEGLLALWVGRCAITGVDEPALLRASHAKPWKDASDSGRLDVYNGLLLAAHRDTAFDEGLITLDENGVVIPSAKLSDETLAVLGLTKIGTKIGALNRQVVPLRPQHQPYMAWHRTHVLRNSRPL
ncbi:MAG: HNH endonuclease, partial [Rugosibacter sp.]